MHVHDHRVRHDAEGGGVQLALHRAEGVVHGVHVHPAQHIHDQHPAPVGGGEHIRAPARRVHQARIVGRSDQARLAHDVGQGLALVPGMVAQGQHVRARVEDFARGVLGDAEAARRILGVDHHEIQLQVAAQAGQVVGKAVAAGLAHHIAEESQSHSENP